MCEGVSQVHGTNAQACLVHVLVVGVLLGCTDGSFQSEWDKRIERLLSEIAALSETYCVEEELVDRLDDLRTVMVCMCQAMLVGGEPQTRVMPFGAQCGAFMTVDD